MRSVDFRLLLVTDRHQTQGRPLITHLGRAIEAGVPAIQLRERDLPTVELLSLAQKLQAMTEPRSAGVSRGRPIWWSAVAMTMANTRVPAAAGPRHYFVY